MVIREKLKELKELLMYMCCTPKALPFFYKLMSSLFLLGVPNRLFLKMNKNTPIFLWS